MGSWVPDAALQVMGWRMPRTFVSSILNTLNPHLDDGCSCKSISSYTVHSYSIPHSPTPSECPPLPPIPLSKSHPPSSIHLCRLPSSVCSRSPKLHTYSAANTTLQPSVIGSVNALQETQLVIINIVIHPIAPQKEYPNTLIAMDGYVAIFLGAY